MLQIVTIQPDFYTLKQIVHQLCIATHRYSLVQRIEVVVVKRQTHRQAADDERGEVQAIASPLLFGVALD